MDEMTHADRGPDTPVSEAHDRGEHVEGGAVRRYAPQAQTVAHQVRLPFDQLPALPLPYDDEADAPIGFALTARARRTIAPHSLPALSVVAGADAQDPHDTRPARARALRRAGFPPEEIARQLAVDDLLVRAWTDDLPVARGHRGSSRAARAAAVLAAPTSPTGAGAPAPAPAPTPAPGSVPSGDDQGFAAARRVAAADGRRRLTSDAGFAVGVGLMVGLVTVDRHAVVFRTSRPELAARLISWSCEQAGADRRDVRIVLRVGGEAAADVVRHRWSSALGLGIEQLAATRWRQAPTGQAVEALVRISDPAFAARVAGWCDALLRPEVDPADVAF